MTLRVIELLPAFVEKEAIQELQNKLGIDSTQYPLATTLVYPFQSSLTDEQLSDHILSVTSSIKPFRILARDITGFGSTHLLLNVKVGNDSIILLRDLLYSDALKKLLNPYHSYFPHIVLGAFPKPEQLRSALQELQNYNQAFEATITAVALSELSPEGIRTTTKYFGFKA